MDIKLDKFTKAYIECALWASTDDNNEPLDGNYSIWNLADETIKSIIDNCKNFQDDNEKLFEGQEIQAGHDFWLTRNHHGAGFWDRGHNYYPKDPNGDILTQNSHSWGSCDLYIAIDGKIYSQ